MRTINQEDDEESPTKSLQYTFRLLEKYGDIAMEEVSTPVDESNKTPLKFHNMKLANNSSLRVTKPN